MSKATLTVEQAAEYLGISRGSAYTAVRTGEIPHIRIGNRILVPRIALENLIERATSRQAALTVAQE